MARMALRPALRAYAHAPAGVEVAAWTPASIPQTVLWIDAADDAYRTIDSGTKIATILDKGFLNADAWAAGSGAGALTEGQTWTATVSGSSWIDHMTITGQGKGNKFFVATPTAGWPGGLAQFIPTTSPYNLTGTDLSTKIGSAAVESNWLLWQVCHISDDNTDTEYPFFLRGENAWGSSTAYMQDVRETLITTPMGGDWVSSTAYPSWTTSSSPVPWVPIHGKTTVLFLQSWDDGGTRKYRFSQTGSSWHAYTHGKTDGAPVSASNRWTLQLRHGGATKDLAIGEAGFAGGIVSDADIALLYTYLDDKWDLGV